jgi:hypothetical protein
MHQRLSGMLVRAAIGATVVGGGLAAAASVKAGATTTSVAPDVGTYPGNWSPAYMALGQQPVSEATALAVAEAHDVIVAQPPVYAPWVTLMKQVNPNLVIFAYQNASFSHSILSFPESVYSHDSSGHRIQSLQFQTYLMVPNSSAWESYQAQLCTQDLKTSHYDGCYLDTMGDGILSTGYLTALPVIPGTGTAYTDADWVSVESTLAQAIKSANGNAPLLGNMLGNGQRYFSSNATTVPILKVLGGGVEEMFLRESAWPITTFKSPKKWIQDVTSLSNAESLGDYVAAITKVWVPGATTAQVDAWHRYALASFLLGTGGHDRFSFMTAGDSGLQIMPYDHVAIGQPLSSMVQVGAAYERQYTNGLVVVNPSSGPVTIPLTGSYVNLDGTVVTSSITLGADTGDVLVPANPMPAPSATTAVPTVSAGTATLSGIVSGRGSTGFSYFEWGTTTSYGHTTPAQTLGAGWAAVSASVSGLVSGTLYDYRVVTVTPAGTTYGPNIVFKA